MLRLLFRLRGLLHLPLVGFRSIGRQGAKPWKKRHSAGRSNHILFIGHEASRTGAPMVLLRLVKYFRDERNVDCTTILNFGGELLSAYERISKVRVSRIRLLGPDFNRASRSDFQAELSFLLDGIEKSPPDFVICSTAEVAPYAEALKSRGLPVITLMHELAFFYRDTVLRRLVDASDLMVLSSEFSARQLKELLPGSNGKIRIHAQGLLRDAFGRREDSDRGQTYGKLGISVDDIVVVACGTPDGRKGFDIFIDIARMVRKRSGEIPRITFVWIGAPFRRELAQNPRWLSGDWDTTKFWALWDYHNTEQADQVKFVAPVEDIEPWLATADIFVLTSRADPFPCVVQDAMAVGLPVVAFADCGGVPEALGEDCGVVVPYLDRPAMAAQIVELSRNEQSRVAIGSSARKRALGSFQFSEYGAAVASLGESAPATNSKRSELKQSQE